MSMVSTELGWFQSLLHTYPQHNSNGDLRVAISLVVKILFFTQMTQIQNFQLSAIALSLTDYCLPWTSYSNKNEAFNMPFVKVHKNTF